LCRELFRSSARWSSRARPATSSLICSKSERRGWPELLWLAKWMAVSRSCVVDVGKGETSHDFAVQQIRQTSSVLHMLHALVLIFILAHFLLDGLSCALPLNIPLSRTVSSDSEEPYSCTRKVKRIHRIQEPVGLQLALMVLFTLRKESKRITAVCKHNCSGTFGGT
jgi:hypothetical protein